MIPCMLALQTIYRWMTVDLKTLTGNITDFVKVEILYYAHLIDGTLFYTFGCVTYYFIPYAKE